MRPHAQAKPEASKSKNSPPILSLQRRLKTLFGKAAPDECTGDVPSGYVEDAFEGRTPPDGVFRRRQKRK